MSPTGITFRRIQTVGKVVGAIRPPGSKSLTNRALICAAAAQGVSVLEGALDCEDTQVMLDALKKLQIPVRSDSDLGRIEVHGCAGHLPCRKADLFVANSGTSMRFLAAMLAALGGEFRLDGVPRMRQRPLADLLDALAQLSVEYDCQEKPGFAPVVLRSQGLQGSRVVVRGDVSSQFLSGLLMAAPYARQPLTICLTGPLVSRPYVTMTLRVMEAFGVQVQHTEAGGQDEFHVDAPCLYQGCRYLIEPDASAASYFWAAAAITGGRVLVRDLFPTSLQGDVAFCRCLEAMGCRVEVTPEGTCVEGGPLHGIDVDMNAISDTVPTLAAVALFAQGPTRIRNVAHIRHKETDRIGDLAREIRRLGAEVVEFDDGLEIQPRPLRPARICTYQDHRMAMSFTLVGLRQPGIEIENPQCVAKTYPRFFEDLERLVGQSQSVSKLL